MVGKLFVVCFVTVAYAQDYSYYTFNNGNCPNNDCCVGLTCSCDTDVIQEMIEDYSPAAVPTPGPADGSKNNVTVPQSVGWGIDSSGAPRSSAGRCDHAVNVTVIHQTPFAYDGDLKYCEWYVGPDCRDDAPQSVGKENSLINFGIFEQVGGKTCSYKMLGYTTVTRAQYYQNHIKKGGAPGIVKFDFTRLDLSNMGIGDQHIKGLSIGFFASGGGCIGYQQWSSSFASTNANSMCIYDSVLEFESWDQYDLTTKPTRSLNIPLQLRQENRRYNMQCVYQPL